jgi:transposase
MSLFLRRTAINLENIPVRVTTLLNRMIGLPGLWVKGFRFEGETLVLEIGRRFRLLTCSECGTRVSGRFEEHSRRWRHVAVWGRTTLLEGAIRRLRCPTCVAVRTEEVPWARTGSAFTRMFEDVVGFLTQQMNQTAVAKLADIAWLTVGSIAGRLVAKQLDEKRFEGVRRIGVDEISYRRHHKYLTVVVDHDRERVIWVGEGKSSEALGEFFTVFGQPRTQQLELISVDLSPAYLHAIRKWAPQAQVVHDRFHVARLGGDAVDEVRRQQMSRLPPLQRARLKGSRWALLKRPHHLNPAEQRKLSSIARFNEPIYRAHLLKESFLEIFTCDQRTEAEQRVEEWLSWATHSRLKPFVRLARTVRLHLAGILAFIESGLTNARLEGMNNKIRLLSHRAFGFHTAQPLMAMVYLCCSGIMLPQLQLI